jgi:RNA polymerase sigma factor (sigma-70 family)
MNNSAEMLSGSRGAKSLLVNMGHVGDVGAIALGGSDQELLAASLRGEVAAYGKLVSKYQSLVCAVTFSSTRDAGLAEDVAQDAFVSAWQNLRQLRETSRFRFWLCGIARNLARKAKRKAGRELPDDSLAEITSDRASPFDDICDAQTAALVQRALHRIPEKYREVLVLYYHQDQSAREVADVLGISEQAVVQRLSRGRSYLAEHMTVLVESSLENARPPKRNLSASVLAAIGPGVAAIPSLPGAATIVRQPHALTTAPKGATGKLAVAGEKTMLKVIIGITAALGAAGTAIVATRGGSTSESSLKVSGAQPVAAVASAKINTAGANTPPALPLAITATAGGPGQAVAGESDGKCETDRLLEDSRAIAPALIESTGLHRGISRGEANAPVTIVVFTDMQCQFCGKVLGTIDQLMDEYPGKLKLVVKQFPIPGHSFAQVAAEATLAANAQGKYWPYHDLLIASQDELSMEVVNNSARQVGLDMERFSRELAGHTYAAAVEADVAVAREVQVQGTPTFSINGNMFAGARPIAAFRLLIDAELAGR